MVEAIRARLDMDLFIPSLSQPVSSQERSMSKKGRHYFAGRDEMDDTFWICERESNSGIALDVISFSYSYIPSVQNFECKGEMIIQLAASLS
jgi:hypothetical protein